MPCQSCVLITSSWSTYTTIYQQSTVTVVSPCPEIAPPPTQAPKVTSPVPNPGPGGATTIVQQCTEQHCQTQPAPAPAPPAPNPNPNPNPSPGTATVVEPCPSCPQGTHSAQGTQAPGQGTQAPDQGTQAPGQGTQASQGTHPAQGTQSPVSQVSGGCSTCHSGTTQQPTVAPIQQRGAVQGTISSVVGVFAVALALFI